MICPPKLLIKSMEREPQAYQFNSSNLENCFGKNSLLALPVEAQIAALSRATLSRRL